MSFSELLFGRNFGGLLELPNLAHKPVYRQHAAGQAASAHGARHAGAADHSSKISAKQRSLTSRIIEAITPSRILDQRRFYQTSHCFADLLGACSIDAGQNVDTRSVCKSLKSLDQLEKRFQSKGHSSKQFLEQRFPKYWLAMNAEQRVQLRCGLDNICQQNQLLADDATIRQLRALVTTASIQDASEQAKNSILYTTHLYLDNPNPRDNPDQILTEVDTAVIKTLYGENATHQDEICKQDASFRYTLIRQEFGHYELKHNDGRLAQVLSKLSDDSFSKLNSDTPSWFILSPESKEALKEFKKAFDVEWAKDERADVRNAHAAALEHAESKRAAARYAQYEKKVLLHITEELWDTLNNCLPILTDNTKTKPADGTKRPSANALFFQKLLHRLDTFMPRPETNGITASGYREKIIDPVITRLSPEDLEKLSGAFGSDTIARLYAQLEDKILQLQNSTSEADNQDAAAHIRKLRDRIDDLKQIQLTLDKLKAHPRTDH